MRNSAEVVVFACNWDGLSCIETAARDGLCYPAAVKVIRVSCLSRVHLGLILKAFELKADGVMLLGCSKDECHYDVDSRCTDRDYEKARDVLELMGVGAERMELVRLTRGDGAGFADQVNEFVSRLGKMRVPSKAS